MSDGIVMESGLRERFEAWHRRTYGALPMDEDGPPLYNKHDMARVAWDAFQAGATQPPES
jgi:hypothetical protein